MMNTFAELILVCAALVGLWWLLFFGFPQLLVDRTRQKLFALRDDLFQRAAKGQIAFDAKAYQLMRRTLNGMIRYTHELSLLRLLSVLVVQGRYGLTRDAQWYQSAFDAAMNDLTPKQQALIQGTKKEMHRIMLRHMVLRAPVIPLAFIAFSSIKVARRWALAREQAFLRDRDHQTGFSLLDAEAEHLHQHQQAAAH